MHRVLKSTVIKTRIYYFWKWKFLLVFLLNVNQVDHFYEDVLKIEIIYQDYGLIN